MNMNQENIIKQLQLENEKEHNMIPLKDVDLIKIKLGKSHRKESDWQIIKDILSSHNVIVAEPDEEDPRVNIVEHIICEDDRYLLVFTNFKDFGEYITGLNRRIGFPQCDFHIGSMPFEQAVDISEMYHMDLFIDYVGRQDAMCMMYIHGENKIKAVMLKKA